MINTYFLLQILPRSVHFGRAPEMETGYQGVETKLADTNETPLDNGTIATSISFVQVPSLYALCLKAVTQNEGRCLLRFAPVLLSTSHRKSQATPLVMAEETAKELLHKLKYCLNERILTIVLHLCPALDELLAEEFWREVMFKYVYNRLFVAGKAACSMQYQF